MPEITRPNAFVQTNNSEMEAYLQVPTPEDEKGYTIGYLHALLEQNGIRYGIIDAALKRIIDGQIYNQPVLVASGNPAVDGVDGYYEYKFNTYRDSKPQMKEDGSVDYWSVNSIQSVIAGDVIAIYHPPVQGADGTNVRGAAVLAKRGKDQAMLKGKGFVRSEDGLTYTAEIDGKIEMQGDRIMVLAIHEIGGDADISTGNIDFRGDVVIHGNVENGIVIKATGSITIDGTVEACTLQAGKDIILRRGMLGGNRASVKTKGNIFAKFFENTTIEADGNIQADVLMNCEVDCKGKITLTGRRASIIGGEVHAVEGVEVFSLGNDAETKTYIYVGADPDMHARLTMLEKKIAETKEELAKVEKGIEQFKLLEREKNVSYASDPRRMALLRIRIRDNATLAEAETELRKVEDVLGRGVGASVKVLDKVHPGVRINIGIERLKIQNEAANVEFYLLENKIRTRPAS
ncbi:MAG: DUF342 domain-containing protein [Roseburia sp.]|nr:DUF342 domain-containing protein [Roseburia sp.]